MSVECPQCGETFGTERGLNIHRSKSHKERYKQKEVLQRLYHEEGLTQGEIADKFGIKANTIGRWMDRLGVDARMAYQDPRYPPHHHFFDNPNYGVGYEYERVSTQVDGTLYTFPIHRLIAVAIGELDPPEFTDWDVVIHHESKHGLDNRHDNLERMERGDHTAHHKPWRGHPSAEGTPE